MKNIMNDSKNVNNTKILILCVNFHSEIITLRFIKELLNQDSVGLIRIVIIDNDDNNVLLPFLSTRIDFKDQIIVFRPGRNLGYFGGVNWGLQQYLNNAPLPDWVIVSNVDIAFKSNNFFSNLLCWDNCLACEVIAPSIFSTLTGRDQNPHLVKRPSYLRMKLYKLIFRYYITYTIYLILAFLKQKLLTLILFSFLQQKNRTTKNNSQVIYAPHGSFIIFRKKYFEKGGNLNYGAFLFAEEIFVAETARKLGFCILYDPKLKVIHKEHVTTGIIRSREMAKYQFESIVYCTDAFFKNIGNNENSKI